MQLFCIHGTYNDNEFSFKSEYQNTPLERRETYITPKPTGSEIKLKSLGIGSEHDFDIFLGEDLIRKLFDFSDSKVIPLSYDGVTVKTKVAIEDSFIRLDLLEELDIAS